MLSYMEYTDDKKFQFKSYKFKASDVKWNKN